MTPTVICNLINDRFREPTERRWVNGWQLPATTADDVALAIKVVRAERPPQPLEERIAALKAIGREARWMPEHTLRELAGRTGSPIQFLRFSIGRVNRWLSAIDEYVALFGQPRGRELRAGPILYTGGIPSHLVLAGDSTALAALAMGTALLSGARLVVKGSAAEPVSAYLFAKAAIEHGLSVPNLLFFDTSLAADRGLIASISKAVDQSVVYGEDRTIFAFQRMLNDNATHKLIPYWTGRSGVVVLPDADVALAARQIVHGATEDRGNRCISTKKVFAPAEMGPELERLMCAAADRLRVGDPQADATDVGVDPAAGRELALQHAADSEIVYDRHLIVARCRDGAALLREEVPYPILGVRYYTPTEDPIDVANQSVKTTPTGRALVMSVFTRSAGAFEDAAVNLRAHKVLLDEPTTNLDLSSLHQGIHLFTELMRSKYVSRS